MSRSCVPLKTRRRSPNTDVTEDEGRVPGEGDYFTAVGNMEDMDNEEHPLHGGRWRAPLSIKVPPRQAMRDTALSALQYLPMPVLVLSSTTEIVLANEAMGRLLGLDPPCDDEEDIEGDEVNSQPPSSRASCGTGSATEVLQGRTLAQLEMDLLQDGSAVFIAWEDFMGTVVDDASRAQSSTTRLNTHHGRRVVNEVVLADSSLGRSTSAESSKSRLSRGSGNKAEVHDAVVDVVFSTHRDGQTGLPLPMNKHDVSNHVQARMIISVWATDDDQFFTLTFTAASPTPNTPADARPVARTVSRSTTSHSTSALSGLSSPSGSSSSGQKKTIDSQLAGKPASTVASPCAKPVMDFLPNGPPATSSDPTAPTMFTKSNKLKDAILNSMSFPAYAMWKDESFGIANKAAIKLLYPWMEDSVTDSSERARDFLAHHVLYTEDFTAKVPLEEFPIFRLMREQKRLENYRVGIYSAKDGSRLLFDVSGEPIVDDNGDFLGGIVMFHDITGFATTITKQQKQNERQFEEITHMIPQIVWRTSPEGLTNYYSPRWYEYTGLSVEESQGAGWLKGFHPEDLAIAEPQWKHSIATGEEFLTEYRCRAANGDMRWMLGRALPMRDESGKITAWFGTCTDTHELILAREEAKQTRARMEQIIEHACITLWAIDMNRNLVLFEGQPMYDDGKTPSEAQKMQMRNLNIYEIFKMQGRQSEGNAYKEPMEAILAGKSKEEVIEVQVESTQRWFRTRFIPLLRQDRKGGIEGDAYVDGVVGVSMDVTDRHKATQEAQERDQENEILLAQSAAAREASKMKSQFLANMSHEIRTPIAGVIGMSEILLDEDALTPEQRECAENIQRSANGLLTVINDILDFSKVESGRLDIEEVQFDLSVVIRDINKMLGFAAERKGLMYVADIQQLSSWKVIGDPGRLRQVITNLLTNSIKFTAEGSVTMRVKMQRETDEVMEVQFSVEDTGIGIEEQVRQRLFKPFSQADSSTARRFGGTGLGLTISKNLVGLMHGNISLESRLGQGTKASFWIPFQKVEYQSANSPLVDIGSISERLKSEFSLSRTSSEGSRPLTPTMTGNQLCSRGASNVGNAGLPGRPENPSSTELTEAERNCTNVLVVEDNPINQQIALKTIKKLGFAVKAVWNGKEAVEYLRKPSEDQPCPDIILMDIQMPQMDGYLATYTIRNASYFVNNPVVRSLPIVAMTASAIQGDREKCQKSGMDDYLAKPVKKMNLEKMLVKWAIEGRRKRAELYRSNGTKSNRLTSTRRTNSSFDSGSESQMITPQEQLSSQLDRLDFSNRAALERSSENAGDSALRQQRNDEQAITLRNDVLLHSGDNPRSKLDRAASDQGSMNHEKEAADPKRKLTAANMQKLAGTEKSRAPGPKEWAEDNSSSLFVNVEDRASPPPPTQVRAVYEPSPLSPRKPK